MIEIHQIMALGSESQIHLLGNPYRPITQTVELRLFSGTGNNRAFSPLFASFARVTRRRSKIDQMCCSTFDLLGSHTRHEGTSARQDHTAEGRTQPVSTC